jgi:hypothetical protein
LEEQALVVMVESQSVSRSPQVIPKTVEDITSQIQDDILSTTSVLMNEVEKVTGQVVMNMTITAIEIIPSASPSLPPSITSSAFRHSFATRTVPLSICVGVLFWWLVIQS